MLSKYIEIPEKGRAVVQTEEIDCENLAPNEAIIKATATLVSAGTELSRVFEIKKGFSYPVRPGYSAVGRVLKKGDGLPGIEVGDLVYYSGPHSSLCRFSAGDKTQGPMIFKLPESIDPVCATMTTLGLVAANAVRQSSAKLGDTVAVYGLGVIGILTCLLMKESPARVVGIDTVKSRCDELASFGIETLCCPASEQVERVKQLTSGKGPDISIDVTGASPAILNAIAASAAYGQIVLLGSPREGFTADVTPALNAIHMKMLTVKGAFNNLFPVYAHEGSRLSVERNFAAIVERIADGRIDVRRMLSHVIKPEETEAAYHGLMYDKENYRCVAIDWEG